MDDAPGGAPPVPFGGINPLRADADLPPRLEDVRDRIDERIRSVDPAHEGAHVDYDHPERGAVPPAAGGFLRLSVGDERGAVFIDVPREEVVEMSAGRLGFEVFEMLKELDARNAARDEDDL